MLQPFIGSLRRLQAGSQYSNKVTVHEFTFFFGCIIASQKSFFGKKKIQKLKKKTSRESFFLPNILTTLWQMDGGDGGGLWLKFVVGGCIHTRMCMLSIF